MGGEIEQNKSKWIFYGLGFTLDLRVPQPERLLLVWLSHLILFDQLSFELQASRFACALHLLGYMVLLQLKRSCVLEFPVSSVCPCKA